MATNQVARQDRTRLQKMTKHWRPVERATGIDKNSFNIGSIKNWQKRRKSAGIRVESGRAFADSLNHPTHLITSWAGVENTKNLFQVLLPINKSLGWNSRRQQVKASTTT